TLLGLDSGWIEVRAGGSFTLALRADGTIWGWGRNDSRQLGLATNVTEATQTNVLAPVQIGTSHDWSTISAGVDHSVGVQTDGTLWAWGRNFSFTGNQIYAATNVFAVPTLVGGNTNWVIVDAGYDHSLAIDKDGHMFAWGGNSIGQLGNGSAGPTNGTTNEANRTTPVQIGAERTWAAIDAGMRHSLALASDGTIWAWGWNNQGQVGDGTAIDRKVPVQLVFTNVAGVLTNWINQPPTISTQSQSVTVIAGSNATLFVTAAGSGSLAYQWQFNTTNALPGSTNATLVITNFQQVNAGVYDVVITN